jgi:muramoyltetrapeptide carboxypeptidase
MLYISINVRKWGKYKMVVYPILQEKATIGVTALSSGVPNELHDMFQSACSRLESKGFHVLSGDTVWTQHKAKSAPAAIRAQEFNSMMASGDVDMIIPPWGGELLIETLEHINFDTLQPKWILGYSDTSMILLAITLKTGMATAHGTNLVDLRGEYSDATTARWLSVLKTKADETVVQHSSEKYQEKWQHDRPSPCVFNLTEKTEWKSIGGQPIKLQGRLLGGCIDIIRHLIGTPFGDVTGFRKNFIHEEPILWYLENCELNTTDLRRSLVQMKLAGWFENCSGILFGRSAVNVNVDGYSVEDVYQDLSADLQIPIVYDIDCGHQPPQMTLINGAWAEVSVSDGKGTVIQHFIK